MPNNNEQPVNIMDRVITVPSIVNDFPDEKLNFEYHSKTDYQNAILKYGTIFKIVQFSETDNVDLLKQYAKEWIRKNYYDGVHSFTVKAVDLHLLGYNKDKIMVGDRILVMFKTPETSSTDLRIRFTCLSAQYDLLKPENSTYKIGIPDTSTNIKYRESISVNRQITRPPTTPPADPEAIEEIVRTVNREDGLLPDEET